MSGDASYVVAGNRPWNRPVFDRELAVLPGRWHFISSSDELTADALEALAPRYVFFLHWSWIVSEAIVAAWECVCFHMTDLPYGRGGSPLQNLILRGHRDTKLTAFRMTDELDAGPVYAKRPLSLEGSAQQIYERATASSAAMIRRIVEERPEPRPQQGDPVVFRRRKPKDSEIPPLPSPSALYDFIRMLDADGYPRAFVVRDGLRYEFRNARLVDGAVEADVRIVDSGEEVDR